MAEAPQPLNLALQGGGSHGAFTWGVLDVLLEDGSLGFDGISGTSAGAMNAVALAHGFAQAARSHRKPERIHAEGCVLARQTLRNLWEGVGAMGSVLWGVTAMHKPLMGWMSQWFSPYQTNPLDYNPLRQLLERTVDFADLQGIAGKPGLPQLFVCATNVRTGRGHIFDSSRISADAVMASACLPQLFKAVEIEGEHYWDGGFSGNPALRPLVYRTSTADTLLVQINPIEAPQLPSSANDIMERVNEVTFNASLLAELRSIDFVRRLLDQGRLDAEHYKSMRLHHIDGGAALAGFGASSKTRTDLPFLLKLFELGRAHGQQWLQTHRSDVGVRQTMDIADNP